MLNEIYIGYAQNTNETNKYGSTKLKSREWDELTDNVTNYYLLIFTYYWEPYVHHGTSQTIEYKRITRWEIYNIHVMFS